MSELYFEGIASEMKNTIFVHRVLYLNDLLTRECELLNILNSLLIIEIHKMGHVFQNKNNLIGWYARVNWQCFAKSRQNNSLNMGYPNWPGNCLGGASIYIFTIRHGKKFNDFPCHDTSKAVYAFRCIAVAKKLDFTWKRAFIYDKFIEAGSYQFVRKAFANTRIYCFEASLVNFICSYQTLEIKIIYYH